MRAWLERKFGRNFFVTQHFVGNKNTPVTPECSAVKPSITTHRQERLTSMNEFPFSEFSSSYVFSRVEEKLEDRTRWVRKEERERESCDHICRDSRFLEGYCIGTESYHQRKRLDDVRDIEPSDVRNRDVASIKELVRIDSTNRLKRFAISRTGVGEKRLSSFARNALFRLDSGIFIDQMKDPRVRNNGASYIYRYLATSDRSHPSTLLIVIHSDTRANNGIHATSSDQLSAHRLQTLIIWASKISGHFVIISIVEQTLNPEWKSLAIHTFPNIRNQNTIWDIVSPKVFLNVNEKTPTFLPLRVK